MQKLDQKTIQRKYLVSRAFSSITSGLFFLILPLAFELTCGIMYQVLGVILMGFSFFLLLSAAIPPWFDKAQRALEWASNILAILTLVALIGAWAQSLKMFGSATIIFKIVSFAIPAWIILFVVQEAIFVIRPISVRVREGEGIAVALLLLKSFTIVSASASLAIVVLKLVGCEQFETDHSIILAALGLLLLSSASLLESSKKGESQNRG